MSYPIGRRSLMPTTDGTSNHGFQQPEGGVRYGPYCLGRCLVFGVPAG
jgi:hypothetical protein